MNNKYLFILRHVPGAGSSTLGSIIAQQYYEADMYQYVNGEYKFDPVKVGYCHKRCQDDVELSMQNGVLTIAISNTNTTERELVPYYDLAKKYGYTVFCLVVENRHNGKDIHSVPEYKLIEMEQKLRNSIKLR